MRNCEVKFVKLYVLVMKQVNLCILNITDEYINCLQITGDEIKSQKW